MNEKIKKCTKIILNLYKDGKLSEEDTFDLLEAIFVKEIIPYYPTYPTISTYEPQVTYTTTETDTDYVNEQL